MHRASFRLALVAVCAATWLSFAPARATPSASLDVSVSPAKAAKRLDQFRQRVRTLAAQGKRPVVVFDVDDTLMRIYTKKAVPGAVPFVNALIQDGASVVYQCGRKESQRAKTTQQLTNIGLTVDTRSPLWLKPQSEKAKTVEWKRSQKPEIKALGYPLGFFDNEKVNARMFRKEFPKSTVFRLNTSSYYPDPGGKGKIWVIDKFPPLSN